MRSSRTCRRPLPLLAAALMPLVLAAAPPALAEDPDFDLEAEVAAGYDSNPLELSGDTLPQSKIPGGRFTQVSVASRLTGSWTPRAGWLAGVEGRGRFHPSSFDEADTAHGRVEAGLGFVLWSRDERKLSLALRGAFGADRGTFVDPATGVVYQVGDPNDPLAIPDRFDVDTTALHMDLRLRTSERLLLLLDSSFARDDYTEDYTGAGVDSLDGRSLILKPGVRWSLAPGLRLDVTGEVGSTRYDELSSIDEDAWAVDDQPRRYRMSGLRVMLHAEPSALWNFAVGAGAGRRDDLYAGYYDTRGDTAFGRVTWSPLEGLRMSMQASQSRVDYQHATLDNTIDGDLREGDLVTLTGGVEKDVARRLSVRVVGSSVRSRNSDPLFTYDRSWALVGLRCAL